MGTLRRELGLVPLAAIIFFNVSGGPYGIEDMIPAFGPGLTLCLLIVTPILWSLPVSLAMSELASALPDEGGYVTWTTRAFGPFWGFQVGWWSWIDSFLDVAVYPSLFVEYVKFWLPGLSGLDRWLVAITFVIVLTGLNLIGVRPAGRAAVLLGVAALVPVVLLVIVGARVAQFSALTPFASDAQSLGAGLGVGLAVAMWNYSGWDTPSTCLGETRSPERTFRIASWLALPLITAAYLFPTTIALASGVLDWRQWETGSLPIIGERIGGAWLGHALVAGALLATAGLFLSLLLTNSRVPYVLARDGLMPARLAAVHPRFGTPWAAIIVSALFYGVLALFSFKDLIVLDIWLYSLGLVVELAAFVWLRIAEPSLHRPWRVPGGLGVAIAVATFPVLFIILAMATAGFWNTILGIAAALTGLVAYRVFKRRVEPLSSALPQ